MTKLAQTLGLTEGQTEIIAAVRQFVDREVIPHAAEFERSDTYPQPIVDRMAAMGLFGLMIPEQYGGLGESLLTYALCVEELARGWMSISGVINTHFIVAYMLRQHGTAEQDGLQWTQAFHVHLPLVDDRQQRPETGGSARRRAPASPARSVLTSVRATAGYHDQYP